MVVSTSGMFAVIFEGGTQGDLMREAADWLGANGVQIGTYFGECIKFYDENEYFPDRLVLVVDELQWKPK